jgi:hypothetical protein
MELSEELHLNNWFDFDFDFSCETASHASTEKSGEHSTHLFYFAHSSLHTLYLYTRLLCEEAWRNESKQGQGWGKEEKQSQQDKTDRTSRTNNRRGSDRVFH